MRVAVSPLFAVAGTAAEGEALSAKLAASGATDGSVAELAMVVDSNIRLTEREQEQPFQAEDSVVTVRSAKAEVGDERVEH